MDCNTIQLELDYPLATLRLNRPDRLNALSRELLRETTAALELLDADEQVRAVILCGAGRCFSSGYDITGDSGSSSKRSVVGWKDHQRASQDFARRIWSFPKPMVAAVHSYCLGGACEMAMLCDLTVASEDARFGEPEIRFASGSPALIMPWVLGMKATKELLYTGKMIDAQRALALGMVNEVVPRDQLERRARYHALLISRVAPLAVRLTKEAINRTYEIMGLQNALAYNANLVCMLEGTETDEQRTFEEIRTAEGLKAALAWRDQQFREVEELA